jgi:DNA-directed RNA polymerase
LQHYAALGGDVIGARQVNLEPGQRPSDVYTGVAEVVKAQIAEHAAQGNKLAQALKGKISRKIVKQTVMTNVYGVTFIGAKRQVQKQLEDAFPDFPDLPGVNRRLASSYIAKEIFTALSSMFKGAHDIQYWLTNCAGRISESIAPAQADYLAELAKGGKMKSQFKLKHLKGTPKNEMAAFKSTVVWTTPLKMPVVQPYRRENTRRISTNLQKISILSKSPANPVHKAKQVQAFPPNFIHSLDATHMFLTALKCDEVGLTFAAIHDSFWTHAGDVDTMNAIIRDAFIRMHSDDIIGRLAAEFKARYKDYMHLAGVPNSSPVAQKIQAWRKAEYHFKGVSRAYRNRRLDSRKWDEMLLERRRLTLLASEDPGEREEGEKMITPGSIFEEAADGDLIAPTDVKITPIGAMAPSRADSSNMSATLKDNQQIEVSDIEKAEVVDSATVEDIDAAAATEAGLEMLEDDDAAATEADSEMPEVAEAAALTDDAKDDPEDAEVEADEEEDPDLIADKGELDLKADKPEELQMKTPEPERKKKTYPARLWLWLPLKFPPVPEKVSSIFISFLGQLD